MKFKIVLVLTFLVCASLISFSNRCKSACDGRTMIVMSAQESTAEENLNHEKEITESSPLLRIAVTL